MAIGREGSNKVDVGVRIRIAGVDARVYHVESLEMERSKLLSLNTTDWGNLVTPTNFRKSSMGTIEACI